VYLSVLHQQKKYFALYVCHTDNLYKLNCALQESSCTIWIFRFLLPSQLTSLSPHTMIYRITAIPYQSIITLPYSSNALSLALAYPSPTLLQSDFSCSYHNLSYPILTIILPPHLQDPPSHTCQYISHLSAPIFLNTPHLTTLFFNALDLTTFSPNSILPSSSFSTRLTSSLPVLTLYSLVAPSDLGTPFNYYSMFLAHFVSTLCVLYLVLVLIMLVALIGRLLP